MLERVAGRRCSSPSAFTTAVAGGQPPDHQGGGEDRRLPPRRRGGQVSELPVGAERAIAAPANLVYRLIVDFERHHPRFLPPAFSQFRVERGGVRAGTVHSFRLTVGRRARDIRMRVEEPEPGRVFTESDERSSMATTWVVFPQGAGSRVRVETRWQGAGGVGGFFERLFPPRVLRRLYVDELRLDG